MAAVSSAGKGAEFSFSVRSQSSLSTMHKLSAKKGKFKGEERRTIHKHHMHTPTKNTQNDLSRCACLVQITVNMLYPVAWVGTRRDALTRACTNISLVTSLGHRGNDKDSPDEDTRCVWCMCCGVCVCARAHACVCFA